MSDLISRQAVLDLLKEHRALYCDNTPETFSKLSYAEKSRVDELDTAIATIINLPSVENKGEWILQPSNKEQGERDFIWWKCSKCGQVIYSETEKDREEFHAFCGRCGASMKGSE